MASSVDGQQINDGTFGGHIKFEARTTPLSHTPFSQLLKMFGIMRLTNLHFASRQNTGTYNQRAAASITPLLRRPSDIRCIKVGTIYTRRHW
jgi:hypothetical protein